MNRDDRGFTLLELLLAMAIFSVTAVVFLGIAHQHVRAIENVENRIIASIIAKNKMVETRVYNPWPPEGAREEFQEMAGYRWWSSTKVSKGSEQGTRLVEVSVGIETEQLFDDKASMFTLSTLLTDPDPANIGPGGNRREGQQ